MVVKTSDEKEEIVKRVVARLEVILNEEVLSDTNRAVVLAYMLGLAYARLHKENKKTAHAIIDAFWDEINKTELEEIITHIMGNNQLGN